MSSGGCSPSPEGLRGSSPSRPPQALGGGFGAGSGMRYRAPRRRPKDICGRSEGVRRMEPALEEIKALTFDVFGSVVDYRTTIVAEGERLGEARGFDVDWAAFADAWRGRYRPSLDRVMRGELPWTNLDALHRAALDELLEEFGIRGLPEGEKEHLNGVWYRRHREQSNPNAASREQNGANKNPLHHRGFYRPPGFSCKSPHDREPTSGLEPLT